jgi:hypothetical protein
MKVWQVLGYYDLLPWNAPIHRLAVFTLLTCSPILGQPEYTGVV